MRRWPPGNDAWLCSYQIVHRELSLKKPKSLSAKLLYQHFRKLLFTLSHKDFCFFLYSQTVFLSSFLKVWGTSVATSMCYILKGIPDLAMAWISIKQHRVFETKAQTFPAAFSFAHRFGFILHASCIKYSALKIYKIFSPGVSVSFMNLAYFLIWTLFILTVWHLTFDQSLYAVSTLPASDKFTLIIYSHARHLLHPWWAVNPCKCSLRNQ